MHHFFFQFWTSNKPQWAGIYMAVVAWSRDGWKKSQKIKAHTSWWKCIQDINDNLKIFGAQNGYWKPFCC